MPTFPRPQTPDFLRQACYRLFGHACLRCGENRPLKVAHIRDWPACVAAAGAKIDGMAPPREWQGSVAMDNFHNITNVLPLCSSCHDLFDDKKYPDVTEDQILEVRDKAIKRAEVLARVINFVATELSGRPNRGRQQAEDGTQRYSRGFDPTAAIMPMPWIADAYRAGTLTDNPHMIVTTHDGWHHHVHLEQGLISRCPAALSECGTGARVWPFAQDTPATSRAR